MLRRTLPAVQAYHPMKRRAAKATGDSATDFTDCPERIDDLGNHARVILWQIPPALPPSDDP